MTTTMPALSAEELATFLLGMAQSANLRGSIVLPQAADLIKRQATEIAALKADNDQLNATFDLRHKADSRAIKSWQEVTGRTMTMPDQADLCVFLMMGLDMAQDRATKAEAERDALLATACDEVTTARLERDEYRSEVARLSAELSELRAQYIADFGQRYQPETYAAPGGANDDQRIGFLLRGANDALRERDSARAEAARLREALGPFATLGMPDVLARGDRTVMRERIVDWFGVSDFERAREAYFAGSVLEAPATQGET